MTKLLIERALVETAMQHVPYVGETWHALYAALAQTEQHCIYPDCKCPTETPCLKGLSEQPAQGDSYDAIWNALQRIDTAIVMLPTFEVVVDGGIEACAENIVQAITKASALLQSKPAEPVNQMLLDALRIAMVYATPVMEREKRSPANTQWMVDAVVKEQVLIKNALAIAQAHPAKREPLSDERINRLWDDSFIVADPTSGNQRFKFARAIEAEITKGQ